MRGEASPRNSCGQKLLAYTAHVYTALGLVCAALIAADIVHANYRRAFVWMIAAVLIDASDGTLARRVRVREVAPEIDGRKLDDIVDYLNYTFLPLVMFARAGWLPYPEWLWIGVPLIASAFAFVHTGAKEEERGFFRGFPSYWNVLAFYTDVWFRGFGKGAVLAIVLALAALSVAPVRFVYPNRAPRWRPFFVWGGVAWLALVVGMLWFDSAAPVSHLLLWFSLVYPASYTVVSLYLDWQIGRTR